MAVTSAPATAIETVTTIEAFEALAGEWDDLVRAMPRPSPFLLHGWLAEWWRHYGDGAELAIHVARRDGRLVGALPLVVRRRAGVRVASFMGGRTSVLPDLLLAPDADPGSPRAARAAGLRRLRRRRLPRASGGSRLAAALGPGLELIERIESPVLDLSAGWDAVYRDKTNAKKRNHHRRRRRQLGELGELTSRSRASSPSSSRARGGLQLHALRWEGRPDGSGFATPAGSASTARRSSGSPGSTCRESSRCGSTAGRSRSTTGSRSRAACTSTAWPSTRLSRWSPGLVNTLDAIEAAAGEGMTRVEFLGGGERYKLELADGLSPLYHGFGLASGVRGRAYAAAHLATIRTRLRLKHSPRLHRLYFEDLAPVRRGLRRGWAATGGRIPRARGTR